MFARNVITRNQLQKFNFCTKPDRKHYDIIIAGGGMVGTTLACALGRNSTLSNKSILLLEASPKKSYALSEKFGNRVVSLNPGTRKLLNNIDAWKHIESARFATVKRLQVWDALSDASITFGNESSVDDVSYIIENDLLLNAVNREIEMIDNVDVLYQSRAKRYCIPEGMEDDVKVDLEDGKGFSCELLLGCDGYNSQVRQAMGVKYLNWKYDQMGVVATLKLSEEIENVVAWQRFLPTGPVALLPLTKTLSSLVWSTTPANAKELLQMSESEFVDALNAAIWKTHDRKDLVDQLTKSFDNLLRLMNCPSDTARQFPPKIEKIEEGSRAAFPLGFGHATSYITKGVALVGDAAHRIHPLAGQGVNLGFGDVECLNKVLGKAASAGSKLNNLSYLKHYETARQRHNVPTMFAVEGLHRLYTTKFTPIVALRSLGLQATHALEPLKRAIVSQASA